MEPRRRTLPLSWRINCVLGAFLARRGAMETQSARQKPAQENPVPAGAVGAGQRPEPEDRFAVKAADGKDEGQATSTATLTPSIHEPKTLPSAPPNPASIKAESQGRPGAGAGVGAGAGAGAGAGEGFGGLFGASFRFWFVGGGVSGPRKADTLRPQQEHIATTRARGTLRIVRYALR